MKKLICSMMAAIVFLLSPISAYASTTESMLMYAAAEDEYAVMPLDLFDNGANIYLSAALYNSELLKSMASVQSDNSINIPHDNFGTYFSADASYRRNLYLSTPYSSTDFDKVKFTIEFRDSDDFGLSAGDIELSFGKIIFAVTGSDGSWNRYPLQDYFSHVTYQYAYDTIGSSSSTFSYDSEMPLNKNTVSFASNSINFKNSFDTASSINGSTITYTKGLKINFYFDSDWIINRLDGVPINGIQGGFFDVSYFGFKYLGTDNDLGSNQNQEELVGGLDNINTSITNGLSNVVGSLTQMGNQAVQNTQNIINNVSQMTTNIVNSIDQQRQEVLDGLGLLGDDISNTMTNVKNEITNVGTNISNKMEQTTETIVNTVETKLDEVTTAVDNVKESVTEVKNSILDLPNKIKDMLLGLIVPDAETMSSKFSEFSGLLEQKLGVIYQIPMMLFDFFDTIVNAATTPQASLTLPAFTLPWIDGTTLTVWQPVEYNIIPEGMEVLSDLIQTITSMTCVVLTFSSIKRAYERFLRS